MKILNKKGILLIVVISAVIACVILSFICFQPIITIDTIQPNQVLSVGFADSEEGEIFYEFPKEQTDKIIEILNSAKLKVLFSTKKFSELKGGQAFQTRIKLTNGKCFDVSCIMFEDKYIFNINGKRYISNKEAVYAYRDVYYERYNRFKEEIASTE